MRRLLPTLMAAALSCSIAHATAITYSLSTTASGTFHGALFTDAPVTVTLTGDTANITPGPSMYPGLVINFGTASVTVQGLGSGTFTDSILVDDDTLGDFGPPAVYFLDYTTGTGIVLETGSVFSTYELTGPFGPIAGSGGVASGSMMAQVFPTTDGDLIWTIGQTFTMVPTTFTATIEPTPEPGTLLLVGSGVVAVLARRRFKWLT